jgi:hypothetical protein
MRQGALLLARPELHDFDIRASRGFAQIFGARDAMLAYRQRFALDRH